jgi:hypothetical protein
MEESGRNQDFFAAGHWQAVVAETTKSIAELRQQDSISEVLRHGFAVGTGFNIHIEKNPLTEFENYDKVSSQKGFEKDVREFEERMADAYPSGDFMNAYIKNKQMVKGKISTLKDRKSEAFAKLKVIRTRCADLGAGMTTEDQSLYGGFHGAIFALLHSLSTTTNSALIDYFSDLLATSAEFINPEMLRGVIKGRTLAEQLEDESGGEVADRNKRRATLNNYLLEVNYAKKAEEINKGRTAEWNRVKTDNKKQDDLEAKALKESKAKRARDLQAMGRTCGKRQKVQAKAKPVRRATPKKKKAEIDSDSSSEEEVEEEEDDDDEVILVDGAEFEDEAYRVQLDAKLADIELKAARGDYYLSDFGCFESDFDKKDDDDDLGEGDAGGSGGVASYSSKTDDDELDDDELDDGYYEAQVMLDEEARLEAQARDALIPAHAKATQASLIKNRMNNLLADSDEEQEQHDLVTCVACQEDFEGTSIGEVVFKCGHGLHSKCFDNHTKLAINPDKCPTCNVTWELSDYGVKPPGALEKGVKNKSSEIGGSGKGGGIRLELSEICDALSLPRGTDEAKLLNRIKELVSLSTDAAQSAV